ncbi:MAG: hypothetical protein M0C28_22665 [Candidatus Moduliflexus flocculans]|nr:hypothetical protein [Candidatus Moduliflexus flocculans]
MAVLIRSTGSFVPDNRYSNDQLSAIVDTTDEWIRSHTGIGARHIAPDGMMTSDMALAAARSALERAGIGAEDLDYIVVATASPDYFGFPATACIVQDKLRSLQGGRLRRGGGMHRLHLRLGHGVRHDGSPEGPVRPW